MDFHECTTKIPRIITVQQIERLCNVTGESVRQWCRSNWLKAHKNGKRQEWIITFDDLAEHFEATPKHLEMLMQSSPQRLRDQRLKKELLVEIRKIRRQNQCSF